MVSIVSVWEYDQYYMDAICIEIYIYFVWVNPWCVNFIHTTLSTCDEPLDISEQCSIRAFILHLEGIIKLKIMLFAQKKDTLKIHGIACTCSSPNSLIFPATFFLFIRSEMLTCIRLWNRENPTIYCDVLCCNFSDPINTVWPRLSLHYINISMDVHSLRRFIYSIGLSMQTMLEHTKCQTLL